MEKSSEILIFRPSSNAFGQNMVIFFNSNDNDDDSYYRSLNVFVVISKAYLCICYSICSFVDDDDDDDDDDEDDDEYRIC